MPALWGSLLMQEQKQRLLIQWTTMVDTLQICTLNINKLEKCPFMLKALHKSDPNPDGVHIIRIYEKNLFV